jgi:anaerobic selenocysteine-containing dehydrogenase
VARTAYRTCPFCEATCGLELTLEGDDLVKVRGDADDVFSHGFLCPKGVAIQALHEDPDRLRTPLLKQPDGSFAPASWDEAFAEIDRRLPPLLAQHGRDAAALYIGNPAAHGMTGLLYGRVLAKALGTRNIYTASTVDQRPKEVASGLMFGGSLTIAIPDVDRTDHLLILGANPLASNGSLLTAPDLRGRLRAIQARGGKVVVVDPRRSRTAEAADAHHFIRPGTDAHLLFALVHTIFAEGLARPGRLAGLCDGIDEVERLARDFPPEAAAAVTGIEADAIRGMARELAAAERAAVYGRIGTTTQEFGTLASWLVDVLNVITGNLDREGGALFPRAAAGARNTQGEPGRGRGIRLGRWSSRVRGLPESLGELPVACLAEEIETPGEGQVRALITLAGNPARSTPNSGRLEAALATLDLYVAFDIYVNETTRHADVILPPPSPLQRSHYDIAFYQLSARNVANYSPAVLPLGPGEQDEWRTLLRLAAVAAGQGPDADLDAFDRLVAGEVLRREAPGRDTDELLAALEPRVGPDRILDAMLRMGPYGDAFGTREVGPEGGLSLARLEAAPHGIDLGPLEPRLPEVLRTPSGKVELAPPELVADVDRLRDALARRANGGLVLVGRRQLRSNNSWMHNLDLLVRGKERCTLHVHPDDAGRLGLADGEPARVSGRAGEVHVPVEVTDAVMPGVVSMPHGWGHDADGSEMAVAAAHAGANSNLLSDETVVEPLTGNAVFNGIPVEVTAAAASTTPEDHLLSR